MPSDRITVELTIVELRHAAHALDMYALRLRREDKHDRAGQVSQLADSITLACLAAVPAAVLVKDVDWDWEREVKR